MEILTFFVYDSLKILILLVTIMSVVSFIQSYLPAEKIKIFLNTKFKPFGHIIAASIGIITPFCSCSAVPLFIGLVEGGVPLGVTFTYLIAAPMINEVALIMLLGMFGPMIAGIYVLSGVLVAIVVGFVLGKMKLEPYVEDYVWNLNEKNHKAIVYITLMDRVSYAITNSLNTVKNVYPYVLIGVGIGAFIHGYAPENFIAQFARKDNAVAVPIAVLIGVPLYSNAAGTIPIVKSLIDKGLPIGTALAFMMSVTALSFPEMIILRKVLKPKLLGIYIAFLSLGIILTGYLFNSIL